MLKFGPCHGLLQFFSPTSKHCTGPRNDTRLPIIYGSEDWGKGCIQPLPWLFHTFERSPINETQKFSNMSHRRIRQDRDTSTNRPLNGSPCIGAIKVFKRILTDQTFSVSYMPEKRFAITWGYICWHTRGNMDIWYRTVGWHICSRHFGHTNMGRQTNKFMSNVFER